MKKTPNISIHGIVIFFVVICLVELAIAALPPTMAIPIDETTKYQDSQWSTTCVSDMIPVNHDMKYLTTAAKNYDTTSLSTYAATLYTDSQKAIDDSDFYNVSPYLQDAKKEYRLAMVQANRIAVYANSGVEEYNNGNFEAINSDLKQAIECVKSYNEHIKKAVKLSNNYKSKKR